MMTKDLVVKKSGNRGRGVFAGRSFDTGDRIETCPVILVPTKALDHVREIWEITFAWNVGEAAVALGFGSLYNHSYDPNARYDVMKKSGSIRFTALRRIRKGEEILVNYNGDPSDDSPVWFSVE